MGKTKQPPTVQYRFRENAAPWIKKLFSDCCDWHTWKRYKTCKAANEALVALQKSKQDYYEFRVIP